MSSKFLTISTGGKAGATGPPGPAGPAGATGPQGATGATGPSGGSASTDYSLLTDFDVAKTAGDSYGPSGTIQTATAVAAGDVLYELAGPGYIVDNLGGPVFVGIATAAAAASTSVPVALRSEQGTYVAVNRMSVPSPPLEVKLDASTNGTTQTYPTVAFRDSGGVPNNYSPNQDYNLTFDAGVGQSWTMTPISFGFEHSGGGVMYDRLGIQTSTNGTTWANASLAGFLTSANPTAPWSTSQGSSSAPGWIFPATSSGSPVTAVTVTFTTRYVRFVFFSDPSDQRPGWDITMLNTAGAGNPAVAHNTPLYADAGAPEKVSETPNGPVIAYSRGTDSSGGKIYARLV